MSQKKQRALRAGAEAEEKRRQDMLNDAFQKAIEKRAIRAFPNTALGGLRASVAAGLYAVRHALRCWRLVMAMAFLSTLPAGAGLLTTALQLPPVAGLVLMVALAMATAPVTLSMYMSATLIISGGGKVKVRPCLPDGKTTRKLALLGLLGALAGGVALYGAWMTTKAGLNENVALLMGTAVLNVLAYTGVLAVFGVWSDPDAKWLAIPYAIRTAGKTKLFALGAFVGAMALNFLVAAAMAATVSALMFSQKAATSETGMAIQLAVGTMVLPVALLVSSSVMLFFARLAMSADMAANGTQITHSVKL